MEKPARSIGNKIFSFLPKTATVSFQNPPYSPGRDKRSENSVKYFKANNAGYKSFSGPIISIIPAEARRKSKNGSFDAQEEPTSPKVSCIGQIKHKKNICKSNRVNPPLPQDKKSINQPKKPSSSSSKEDKKQPKRSSSSNQVNPPLPQDKKSINLPKKPSSSSSKEDKKQPKRSSSSIRDIFRGAVTRGRKSSSSSSSVQNNNKPPLMSERAPSLSQMKRFASGRSGLADFDWRDFAGDRERKYYSDEEKEFESDEEEEDDDHEVIIPHSAPIMVGGRVALEPRKEINLWKRRTIAPIRPLELHIP